MNSNTVDLIATDPPFNKGRDFHATPDSLADGASFQDRWSWEKDVHQDWVDQIKNDWPAVWEVIDAANAVYMRPTKKNLSLPRDEVGSDMGAFLCFMSVRLLEMRRVLKSTGSIYLHCDPTASHYLKAVMDAIFGWEQFQNEIVWCYKSGGASPKRRFSKKHDLLFWYSKTKDYVFNPQMEKSYNRNLKPYRFSGVTEYLDEIGWYTLVGMKDYWQIDMVGRTSKERLDYPTQKPLKLYERILQASSNESDIVLDPFAGCATTLAAAEYSQRQWVGIDIWENAHRLVEKRMYKTTGLFGEVTFTKELPVRTDDGQEAVPFLKTKLKVDEPKGQKLSRAEMMSFLLDQYGAKCQGCDRVFDDSRYLELDHNTPRSDGGLNHISNRILLCGPCNKVKSNKFTLSGLRKENKKNGYMSS